MRRFRLIWIALLFSTPLLGQDINEFTLKLIPLKQGISEDKRTEEAEIIGKAREQGINLLRPRNPFLACTYRNGRVFYVFFKKVEPATGTRNYLIQRIHKIEKFYHSEDDPHPVIKEEFMVEAFKLKYGRMKKADQHDGSFPLTHWARREILKECEIGFADVPGIAEGEEWPFDPGYLYHEIQPYGPERGEFDNVNFSRSVHWTLSVSFDQDGNYSVRSPEFGFDAPDHMPAASPD